jgi:ribosomal protein S18 acetylase RimI-like enzyme
MSDLKIGPHRDVTVDLAVDVDVEQLDRRAALLRTFYGDLGGRFDRRLLCADVGGEVVGTALTGPPRDNFGPWVGELYRLHVHPGHRRAGIGGRLHDACLAAWRAAGVTVGVLEVPSHDLASQAFYESHGWRPDGHTRQARHGVSHLRLRRTIN